MNSDTLVLDIGIEDIPKGLSTTKSLLPHEIANKFEEVQDHVFREVATNQQHLINKRVSRQISVIDIFENTKTLFKNSEFSHKDKLLQHHIAATFRECIGFLNRNDYESIYTTLPKLGTDPQIDKLFAFIEQSENYLSDIVHFRTETSFDWYTKLYKSTNAQSINKSEYTSNIPKYLNKVCTDTVYNLYTIYSHTP